jgi:hypothetical protein
MPKARKRLQKLSRLLPWIGAVVLHGLWLLLPLDPPPEMTPPTVPALRAYPKPGSQSWLPILFSLPSPTGFSSVTLGGPVTILPPLQSPLDLRTNHSLDVERWFPPRTPPPLSLSPASTALSPLLTPPARAEAPSTYRWTLQRLEEDSPRFQSLRLPRVPSTPRALYLEGVMNFDRYGQVAHLIIDPPGAPEGQRQDIIQSLRQVRIWPDTAPARIRFRLSLEPSR